MTTRTNREGLRVLDGSRSPDPDQSHPRPVLRVVRGGLAGEQETGLSPAAIGEAVDQTGAEILN